MRSLKVLILEDHPFQMMALHQMLNAIGVFDVLTAESVEDATRALERRGPVDIAICDLQLEGADGLAMIRHLADNKLACAVIIHSSAEQCVIDGVGDVARQLGLEVLGCFQKMASNVVLHQVLTRYVEHGNASPKVPPVPQYSELQALSATELARSQNQWIAHFQPKVSFDGQLVGVEALARWHHPTLGVLSPAQFFPAIEQADLLDTLSLHVLEQALALSARHRARTGQAMPVAVNIAPQLLAREDFGALVTVALEHHGVPASALTLEIVETHGCALDCQQLEELLHLRILGCQLSIDDFGTGVSNLQRLLELPFSELKLPSEFVRGMAQDGKKAAVVAGALMMARRMELSVVVEGVETVDDLLAIQALGRPVMQGYFFARPMPEAELEQWINDRNRAGTPLSAPAQPAGQLKPCA